MYTYLVQTSNLRIKVHPLISLQRQRNIPRYKPLKAVLAATNETIHKGLAKQGKCKKKTVNYSLTRNFFFCVPGIVLDAIFRIDTSIFRIDPYLKHESMKYPIKHCVLIQLPRKRQHLNNGDTKKKLI